MEKDNKFIGYEYKDVIVKREMDCLWKDSYKSFGWIFEESKPAIVKHIWTPIRIMVAPLAILPGSPFSKMIRDHESDTTVGLIFKRDKNITGKAELNRLQLQFENSAKEIVLLEETRSIEATIVAYILGIIGTAFMVGSVFSYIAGMLQLSIILSVPGFLGWILPYFLYSKIRRNKVEKVNYLIDKQYDVIYEICEKASKLSENKLSIKWYFIQTIIIQNVNIKWIANNTVDEP